MLEKVTNILKDSSVSTVLLLFSCLVFVFVLPIIEFRTNTIPIVVVSLIIFFAAGSISHRLVLIGIAAIVIEVATRTTDLIYLNYLAMITTNLFFIFIVGNVILAIMKRENITVYTLIEALNGYLLLSIMFISLVGFCELIFPGSYPVSEGQEINLVYYAIITMTTVGYGDITPQLPVAKSLAMAMAVTGQFYIAVVVAIIVGKYASRSNQ